MARRKKSEKRENPKASKDKEKNKFPVEWVPAGKNLVLIGAILLLITVGLSGFVQRSAYFKVDSVLVQLQDDQKWIADPRIGYRLKVPVHLFKADLKGLARAIGREHPQLERVVVRRVLPDRLVAEVTLREPVGQLRSQKYYLVSADGFILSEGRQAPLRRVPVFTFGATNAVYAVGERTELPQMSHVVRVLSKLDESGVLGDLNVSSVAVDGIPVSQWGSANVTLRLDNGLEIRTTSLDLKPKLARLADWMQHHPEDVHRARYVDLRFDDLAIGMNGDAS